MPGVKYKNNSNVGFDFEKSTAFPTQKWVRSL